MPNRRILSLWFPRLGAERLIRAEPWLAERPFATVAVHGGAQVLASLSAEASRAGLHRGQPLRDAHAMCADLVTRPAIPHREAAFLGALHRWAGKYSPWVASEPPDALVIDLTGCAHLFGGEEPLADQVAQDCADLGLSVRVGLADTLGAAWALARFAGAEMQSHRSGDAIEQEAHATRAKAGKRRHWERGGTTPPRAASVSDSGRIAAPGQSWSALSPLPVASLRIDTDTQEQLKRLGLRRVGDLLGQPRAGLARRFGRGLVDRLDQATGSAPEPVSPARPPDRFAVRLSFPDPIGLAEDVTAALERMVQRLCATLKDKGRGARTLRLEAHRCDHEMRWLSVTAATAHADPHRLLPLLTIKLDVLEAGPGIDMLRLEAIAHEPVHTRAMAGHAEAAARGMARQQGSAALEDLIGRIGARLGPEAVTRRHPASSHIPEKTAQVLAAAWSEPARDWPAPPVPRPLLLWPPEPVHAPDDPRPPERFRWRGRVFARLAATGPERITPEWWLDEPAWRSGPRDYWRVETDRGERLWLFYAHGGTMSSGWFCQGAFA
ncbi:DNA polymerase Y family protein [Thetidibacter halocola]|uniref:DNA-directed DNA polymerase n=1 Tax=Thetidibacter halocola TaxID=2827239 RepID=A0A8J8B5X0_9RHOB|nr:DNA polymerase Y family protein [Thetidibacter halocola]MBS0123376.1 DNA polymerase Y family protein [Thetidibacter halocola]